MHIALIHISLEKLLMNHGLVFLSIMPLPKIGGLRTMQLLVMLELK